MTDKPSNVTEFRRPARKPPAMRQEWKPGTWRELLLGPVLFPFGLFLVLWAFMWFVP